MPSIKDAIQANTARIASGGETGTGVGNPQPPAGPISFAPTPAQDQPAGAGLPQRGMFPANLVLASDRSDSSRVFRGSSMRSGTFPYQPQQIKTAPITATTTISAAAAAASLVLQTNGIPNSNQDLFNLIVNGGTVEANPDGSVIITIPETSSNVFSLIDEFPCAIGSSNISGTSTNIGIGQLGWALLGDPGTTIGNLGGTFPNLGQYGWANNGTASDAGWLTLAGSGIFSNEDHSQLTWAVAENPGTGAVFTFTFKVDTPNPLSSSPSFSIAQTSMYVGLTGPTTSLYLGGSPISRPDVFIGVRYDTSTTAPSIDDSFLTLEVVANPTLTSPTRNNTQGTTLVTTVAPVQGAWHTLVITFSPNGAVTLVLDGTFTLAATVPTFAITADFFGQAQNGSARLSWSVSGSTPDSVWNAGTELTVSGFTSGLVALNGTYALTASDQQDVSFPSSAVIVGASETGTISGYPSFIPIFMMGNDDTATPPADVRGMFVSYFSLIWNPSS